MPARRILQLGDPLLRAVSSPVASPREAEPIVEDLRATLHAFQRAHGFGRGISAVQIGEPKRLIYMEFEGIARALLNPEYEWQSAERFQLWDDCFSFPDLLVHVERAERVRIGYHDETGVSRTLDAAGPLSELIQHEMDHLDGILAIDRALGKDSFCVREEYERRYAQPHAPAQPAHPAAHLNR